MIGGFRLGLAETLVPDPMAGLFRGVKTVFLSVAIEDPLISTPGCLPSLIIVFPGIGDKIVEVGGLAF